MPLFSLLHIVFVLLAWLFAAYAVFGVGRRNVTDRTRFSGRLFFVLLGTELFWTTFKLLFLHESLSANLPLHVSDFKLIALLLALATLRGIFCELACFAGIPVAALAILFPHFIEQGWVLWLSVPRYYIMHAGILAGGLYLTAGHNHWPPYRSMLRAYGVTLIYGIVLIPINRWLGTNYFFTQFPPASVVKWLPTLPWLQYFVGACFFFFLMFNLTWLGLWILRTVSSRLSPD